MFEPPFTPVHQVRRNAFAAESSHPSLSSVSSAPRSNPGE
jgi:hypothetical protein